MRYKVLDTFADLTDKRYKYKTGDIFPRQGLEVSEDRIKELSGDNNKLKKPLIEEIPEEIPEEVSEEPEKKNTKRKKKNAD